MVVRNLGISGDADRHFFLVYQELHRYAQRIKTILISYVSIICVYQICLSLISYIYLLDAHFFHHSLGCFLNLTNRTLPDAERPNEEDLDVEDEARILVSNDADWAAFESKEIFLAMLITNLPKYQLSDSFLRFLRWWLSCLGVKMPHLDRVVLSIKGIPSCTVQIAFTTTHRLDEYIRRNC